MPVRTRTRHRRGYNRTTWFALVLWVLIVGQGDDCERPTGNTDLTLLELEEGGVDTIAGFTTGDRDYDVVISTNPVTVRAESVEAGATISVSYLGATQPVGTGAGETDLAVALGESTIVVIVEATGGARGSYLIHVTHDVAPRTRPIGVACRPELPEPFQLDFDLTVAAPSVAGGMDFTASLAGVARVPIFFLQAASNLVPGGLQQGTLEDATTTVQVRSGATGPDVVLTPDFDAMVPGPTHLCLFPGDQECDPADNGPLPSGGVGNPACVGGALPCNETAENLIDFPVSTDCDPGGFCDQNEVGPSYPGSDCNSLGFCIYDDLDVPLTTEAGVFSADPAGEVLFGLADQDVPGLILCPDPVCTEPYQPDGSYRVLADTNYGDPLGPMGIRFNPGGALFVALECVMAERGGLCTGQTTLGCLTDADCGGAGPCDFTVTGVSMPTPDSSLVSVPIEPASP